MPAGEGAEAEPTIVTMVWDDVTDPLMASLARYVVVTRGELGCRNVDLCASVTTVGRVVVIEKWDSPDAQRAHFDGATLVALAEAARDAGASRPVIDLLSGLSAYDVT